MGFGSIFGSVAEWFKAVLLKSTEGLSPSVSSNLTASARTQNGPDLGPFLLALGAGHFIGFTTSPTRR